MLSLRHLKKLSLEALYGVVSSDRRWDIRCCKHYVKRTTDKGRKKYLRGNYERWIKNE